jgi:deoxyribodipyrimidine photo-lyase
VARFARGAGDDALDRAARVFSVPAEPIAPTRIREWARSIGVSEVAAAFAPVGRAAAALGQAGVALEREGIRLVQLRRDFDQQAWPHATAGFFRFREQIPRLVAGLSGT